MDPLQVHRHQDHPGGAEPGERLLAAGEDVRGDVAPTAAGDTQAQFVERRDGRRRRVAEHAVEQG